MIELPTLPALAKLPGGAVMAAVVDGLRDEAERIAHVQRIYLGTGEQTGWDCERAAAHAVLSAAAETIDRMRALADQSRQSGGKPPTAVLLAADVARSALILDLQATSLGEGRLVSEPADGGEGGAAAA